MNIYQFGAGKKKQETVLVTGNGSSFVSDTIDTNRLPNGGR